MHMQGYISYVHAHFVCTCTCRDGHMHISYVCTCTIFHMHREHVKFSQLREVFTQLQKSHQQLEKELEKRKERESELLAFSAKLSSSNAELTAERADWEAKVCLSRGSFPKKKGSASPKNFRKIHCSYFSVLYTNGQCACMCMHVHACADTFPQNKISPWPNTFVCSMLRCVGIVCMYM